MRSTVARSADWSSNRSSPPTRTTSPAVGAASWVRCPAGARTVRTAVDIPWTQTESERTAYDAGTFTHRKDNFDNLCSYTGVYGDMRRAAMHKEE